VILRAYGDNEIEKNDELQEKEVDSENQICRLEAYSISFQNLFMKLLFAKEGHGTLAIPVIYLKLYNDNAKFKV